MHSRAWTLRPCGGSSNKASRTSGWRIRMASHTRNRGDAGSPWFSRTDDSARTAALGGSRNPGDGRAQAATWNAARLLRADSRPGLVAKGHDADLLIVDGNPLTDITAAERTLTGRLQRRARSGARRSSPRTQNSHGGSQLVVSMNVFSPGEDYHRLPELLNPLPRKDNGEADLSPTERDASRNRRRWVGTIWLERFWQDLRYGCRMLVQESRVHAGLRNFTWRSESAPTAPCSVGPMRLLLRPLPPCRSPTKC